MLRVVRQPCVNLIVKLVVLLPVANSMAAGHFLSQLHFPSCKNSLLGKPQSHLTGEHFPVAFPECVVLLVFSSRVQRALSLLQVPGVVMCQQLSQTKELRELF